MNQLAIVSAIINRRMLVSLIMGFACGLPLLLTLSVLQAWMTEAGVDLTTIGLMTLVGLPYTLKFLWAPIFDRYTLPMLGRRRGWLLVAQLALMGSLVWLGFSDPGGHPELLALAALVVAFCSASQDIVVDAYRREDLPDRELGLGSSLYINGYRVGMLLASGGGLILADHLPFSMVYAIMALCLLPAAATTLLTPEPEVELAPRTLKEAVIDPLQEYFSRFNAGWILLFILMYKIGDTMAAAMTTPFYLDIGFTKTQIGAVVKLFGFWATVAGTLLGGVVMIRLGILFSLWIFGALQALSTAGFALLAMIGPSLTGLSAVIAFENLSAGMGTAAYAGYMASITDKRFTATQYALLTSLMGIPRVLASAPTGWLATVMGWPWFFIFCTLIAVPGLLLLLRIGKGAGEK
jgi:PAT family beta-lactamase induction signal transducer AmpG